MEPIPAGDDDDGNERANITVDDDAQEAERSSEAEPLRAAPSPVMPSAAEVEDHKLTHWPFRSWCDECQLGRGLGEQHRSRAGRERNIAIVGMDYWYMTDVGLLKRSELDMPENEQGDTALDEARESGSIVKCLLIRCHKTKCVFGHIVPRKGDDEDHYAVNLVANDIQWLGHVRLILKSDQEKSLVTLVTRALQALKHKVDALDSISTEHSATYDSQASGSTEVGVRALRGHFRTMRLCLEGRIGRRLPVRHPIMAWLLEHTAMILNASVRGDDGMTPWARVRGRSFGHRLFGFGELVAAKQPNKGPQHNVDGNVAATSKLGTFLGYCRSSNAYKVALPDGSHIQSRSLTRRPMQVRWNIDNLEKIRCTPWDLRPAAEPPSVEFGEAVPIREKPDDTSPPVARRLKITMQTLIEYGFTDDCRQCDHVKAFGEVKPGLQHSETCRQRIIRDMMANEHGAARVRSAELRHQRTDAERDTGAASSRPEEPRDANAEETSAPEGQGNDDAASESDADAEMGAVVAPSQPRQRKLRRPCEGRSRSCFVVDGGAAVTARDLQRARGPAGVRDLPIVTAVSVRACDVGTAAEAETSISLVEEIDCETILALMGADQKGYARERRKASQRIVSEIYSPPRVTKMLASLPSHECSPGLALDITTTDPYDGLPWDFDLPAKRDRALRLIREQKPLVLIGSPMCTAWSTWQRLNKFKRDAKVVERELVRARVHLEFVIMLYREQVEGGRFFIHEHPEHATSWMEESMRALLEIPGVDRVNADQCQYGAEVQYGTFRGMPVKKPTGFTSNGQYILKALARRCDGRAGKCSRKKGGDHVMASGRVARDAAIYPPGLCRAILKGISDQLHSVGIMRPGEVGLHAACDEDDEQLLRGPEQGYSGKFRDDLSKQVLKDSLVHEARRKELDYFASKGVWRKKTRAEAFRRTGRPPITVRWVDVNKGDEQNPRYRSRLVARQLKATDTSGTCYFAPTPPLEALRTVLSFAASEIGTWKPDYRPESENRMQLAFMDISRAYFNAKIEEAGSTFVQLPPEDPDAGTMCGELLRHMYGTRAAADGWQEEYSTTLVADFGFQQGNASPCLFKHSDRPIVLTVHGDDFTAAGPKRELDWFEGMMKERYELTIQPRLGPGKHDAREAVVLNRIVRWCTHGIEYEADPRQVEKFLAECGLAGANSVATPGVRSSFAEAEKDEPLSAKQHTAFRGAAARANYLAADRVDCQFAAKEICRFMAKPSQHSWEALKRLCRYLAGLPRLVFMYEWQVVNAIDIYTDTDWAGCPRTRKSTSGGGALLGTHTIKTWSSTQPSVSLSSGEAELNGAVRGAGVGLGLQSLLRDLGQDVPVRLWTDSSAAIGISSRQGLGKLRHLDVHTLWIQHAVRAGKVDLRKVAGEVNPADLFTKHSLSRDRLLALVKLFRCDFRGGRAEAAPDLRGESSSKATMANTMSMLEQSGTMPIMPHLDFDAHELDILYPKITAPPAVDDETRDAEEDPLVREGYRLAGDLARLCAEQGRKRRLEPSEACALLSGPGFFPSSATPVLGDQHFYQRHAKSARSSSVTTVCGGVGKIGALVRADSLVAAITRDARAVWPKR